LSRIAEFGLLLLSTTVTAPLEVQLGRMPGLQQMTSSSSATASIISLQFDLSINLDVAEQNVQPLARHAFYPCSEFSKTTPIAAIRIERFPHGCTIVYRVRPHVWFPARGPNSCKLPEVP
jgi:hypothetical protein